MSTESFESKAEEITRSLESLHAYLAALTPAERERFPELVAHLQKSVEELQVAQGELQIQNDQLIQVLEELHEERERYRELFNAAPDGYVVTDLQGTILESNELMQSMLHVRRKTLNGKPMLLFLAPSSRPSVMQALEGLRENWGVLQVQEFDAVLRSNPALHVSIRASILRPRGTRPATVRWLFRDITGRHRDQQLLSQMNAELETRVADRTAQLDAALKKAQAASETKDRFLAALSHELRTPLTPVLLAVTQMERDAGIPEEVRRQLMHVRQHIELETRLIDDLLDISRIARGKIQLRKTSLDVHEVLRQAVDICLSPDLLPDKAIKVTLELEAERSYAFADAARLTQVFCNLLQNSLKFTPPRGAITITTSNAGNVHPPVLSGQTEGGVAGVVAVGAEDDNPVPAPPAVDDLCVVSITDTGIGILPETLCSLFNEFEQGGPSITQRYGGLGLGLAIARAIMELHGGTITATSAGRNRGATFTVTLPTASVAPSAVQSPQSVARWNGTALVGAQSRRLLLVEDHAATARTLQKVLEKMGFEVDVADSVRAGLQLAGKSVYDLIISDLGLPDGTGADLLQTLHTILPPPLTPAICLSGYGADRDLMTTASAGFLKHLTKPINVDELVETIRGVLGLGNE